MVAIEEEGPLIGRILNWLFYYLRVALLMAAITAFVFYVVGLPLRQTFGLALCFTILSLQIEALVSELRFKPYRLDLEIRVPVILTDLGRRPSPAEWGAALTAARREGRGFARCTFWAIRRNLFARSDAFRYSTEMKIEEWIPVLTLPAKTEETSHWELHPGIYFRQMGQFYELGLLLPDGWEQEAKQRFPNAEVSIGGGYEEGRKVCVALALLPCAYLRYAFSFWEPATLFQVNSEFVPWGVRKVAKLCRILEALGWKMDQASPLYIEHRYASISLTRVYGPPWHRPAGGAA